MALISGRTKRKRVRAGLCRCDLAARPGRAAEMQLVQLIEALRAPVATCARPRRCWAAISRRPGRTGAFLGVVGRESGGSASGSRPVPGFGRARRGHLADCRSVQRRPRPLDQSALGGRPGELTPVGTGLWLHGDGYHLICCWPRSRAGSGRRSRPGARPRGPGAWPAVELDLVWPGAPLAVVTIDAWLDQPLEPKGAPAPARRARPSRRRAVEPGARAGRPSLLRLPLPRPERPQPGDRRPPCPAATTARVL